MELGLCVCLRASWGFRVLSVSGLMSGKRGLVLGVINERSIAWGICKVLKEHGAEIAVTYHNDNIKQKVTGISEALGAKIITHCDVLDHRTLDSTFNVIKEEWGKMDFLVHSIAHSDKNELDNEYYHVTQENFTASMQVSCYSFTDVARRSYKIMEEGGSMISLSYYGSEKVIQNYNVMGLCKAALESSARYLACDFGGHGVRVNVLSPGPVRTVAASGISAFHKVLAWNKTVSPLKRNVTLEDIGKSALFLLSDLSSGMTGQVVHVDCGYSVVGGLDWDSWEPGASVL